ncbi:MAG TPA: hypothetical protein ENK31_04930 [Nannocystis exedens]|nr:hypothetical protein [Nannocystis exedens]
MLTAQIASASGAVPAANSSTDESQPQLACAKPYTNDRPCVMVYEYLHSSGDIDLRSESITVDGIVNTKITSSPSTLPQPETRPTIASMYDAETYISVWEYTPASGPVELHARLLGNDALPKNGAWTTTLVNTSNSARRPAIACAPDECLLVWEHEYSPTDIDIYGLRVALDGSPIGFPFAIANSTENEEVPAVDAHVTEGGAAFYVVWQEEKSGGSGDHDIYTSFVTGATVGAKFAISNEVKDETNPTIACRFGETCMIAYEFEYAAGDHDLHANVLSNLPDETLTPTTPTIGGWQIASTVLDERKPNIDRDAIFDHKYTITWERDLDATDSIIDVGRFDYTDGTPTSTLNLSMTQGPKGGKIPVVAGSEWDRYLVAWQDSGVMGSFDIFVEPIVFP